MGMSSEIRECDADGRGAAGIPEPVAGAAREGADGAVEGGDDSAVACVTVLDGLSAQMREVAELLREDARRIDCTADSGERAWRRWRHADDLMEFATKLDNWADGVRAERYEPR